MKTWTRGFKHVCKGEKIKRVRVDLIYIILIYWCVENLDITSGNVYIPISHFKWASTKCVYAGTGSSLCLGGDAI